MGVGDEGRFYFWYPARIKHSSQRGKHLILRGMVIRKSYFSETTDINGLLPFYA